MTGTRPEFETEGPDDEILIALGRAWWNGLELAGVMVVLARRVSVPNPESLLDGTMGPLRDRLAQAIPKSGLPASHQQSLAEWAEALRAVIARRNDIAHAYPITDAPRGRGLLRYQKNNPSWPIIFDSPEQLYAIALVLEEAFVDGRQLLVTIWP